MSPEFIEALNALARRVLMIAKQDPELRSCLRALAPAAPAAAAEPGEDRPEVRKGEAHPLPADAVTTPTASTAGAPPTTSSVVPAEPPEAVPAAQAQQPASAAVPVSPDVRHYQG